MDVLMTSFPIFSVSSSVITRVNQKIEYSVILDKGVEARNYNYIVRCPDKMLVQLEHCNKFFSKDYFLSQKKVTDFNIMFNDPDLKREVDKLSFKDKAVQTSLVEKHPLIDELTSKTPFYYDRDSIIESQSLIELVKQVRAYKDATPIDWHGRLYKCFESIDKLKPLKEFKGMPVFLSMNENKLLITADDNDIVFVRKHTWIKNYPKTLKAVFSTYSQPPLYSLGNTGEVSELLKTVWMR